MSETPTPYDLTQDALIGPMRDILLTAAEPPSGPEFSYPVVDQAVSAEMWKKINRNAGNGILAEGGRPFWLRNLDNATNTATISVSTVTGDASAVIHGFFYTLRQDTTVSLPMPSSGTVTYYICLTFDPREESSPQGPISLQVYEGAPPTTFAREHVVLWTVRRSANQLLSDAVPQKYRPFVGGVVSVNYFDELPDPGSLLLGTLGLVREDRTWWYAYTPIEGGWSEDSGPYWMPLTTPRWEERVTGTFEGVDSAHAPFSSLVGGRVSLKGTLKLKSGSSFQPREEGYWLLTLPGAHRPPRSMNFVTATSRTSPLGHARVRIGADGEVRAWVDASAAWVSIDGIEYWVQ